MKRRVVILFALLALLVTGCGSDQVPTAAPVTPPPTDPTGSADAGDQPADDEDADDVLVEQGFPEQCPSTAETFNVMNESTYQVFGQIDQFDQATGQAVSQHVFIGTAWAVGEHLLATNAHVTQAYVDSAESGVQFSRAIAVQSGTGTVVRLLRALTHPDYSGDPLRSPDVGLFTTQEILPVILPLAPDDSVVDLGSQFELVGFPGDVEEFITVTPGQTVPQATSLIGTVSARRSHDDTQQVTRETLDVYQHQAPTTPGTSGSAIAHCGLVFAINNAGTVKMVVVPTMQGELGIDRSAAASNNFAVHVRYIHAMVDLFQANAVQGFELPVPAVIQQDPTGGGLAGGAPGGQPGGGQPGGEQPAGQPDGQVQQSVLQFDGIVDTPTPHVFEILVDMSTGEITGASDWSGNPYLLTGSADLGSGEFMFWDNGPEVNPEFLPGFYFGYFNQDGTMEGYYAEDEVTTFPLQGELWQG